MKRIYIPNNGGEKQSITTALASGILECQREKIKTLCLVTPKNDLSVLSQIVGEPIAKTLSKGKPYTFQGVNFTHSSISTLKKSGNPEATIAWYLSPKDMLTLDELLSIKVNIYVPWVKPDGESWATKWDAETHGAETKNAAINLPIEVQEELKDLTAQVNLSTGLGHPYDLRDAKAAFEKLRKLGARWTPFEIEKWAVRKGWKPTHAAELATLSEKYMK